MAIATLIFFSFAKTWIGFDLGLGNLVLAHTAFCLPFALMPIRASLAGLDSGLAVAAADLYAGRWQTLRRVTLPLLLPALRRGMAFAAATALGEFAVTLFLSRPEWATLTTLIYQRLGRPGQANLEAAMVLACVLMALALVAFLLIEWPVRDRHAAGPRAQGDRLMPDMRRAARPTQHA